MTNVQRIETNHGHDTVTVTATKGDGDFTNDQIEIVFAGRDPTTVSVRLMDVKDVRAIGQALIDAANHLEP